MKTRTKIKSKSNPIWLGLKLSYSALRFNPARLWGALETLSRVAMNDAPKDGASPLTAFPAPYPRLSFFSLDTSRRCHRRDDELFFSAHFHE